MLRLYFVASLIAATMLVTNGSRCKSDEFSCADGSQCIKAKYFCDGTAKCRDGSDEYPLRNSSIKYDANTTFCRVKTTGYICVLPIGVLPQLKAICEDWQQCRSDEFPCADGSRCIRSSWFCGTKKNCRDGSDEPPKRNISEKYDANTTFCRGKKTGHICVLPNELLPYREKYCEDGLECKSDEYSCLDGSRCTRSNYYCDAEEDCRDGSDEPPLRSNRINYDENTTFCRGKRRGHICVLPNEGLPQQEKYCADGVECKSDEYPCRDGSQCIRANYFCDGDEDCRDGSDEPPLRNSSVKYGENTTFCRGKRTGHICVLPNEGLPQRDKYCNDGKQCRSNEFPCLDGSRCIPLSWFCGGIQNCRDGSDEPPRKESSIEYDANTTFCRAKQTGHICVLPNELLPYRDKYCDDGQQCGSNEFSCSDGSRCIPLSWFCGGTENCRDGSDEPPRRNSSVKYDENTTFCRAKKTGHICVLPDELLPYREKYCDGGEQCRSDEFSCLDGSRCVSGSWFCGGTENCRDGSDEPPMRNSSIEYDANTTFCRTVESGYICVLPNELLPYREKYCEDGWECESYEYPCKDGSRCIQSNYFCDGDKDCPDGSDEPPLRNNSINYDETTTFCRGKRKGHICVLPNEGLPQREQYCEDGRQCRRDEFSCADGSRCIEPNWFCDGEKDCPDGSDEPLSRKSSTQYDANTTFCRGKKTGLICILPSELLPQRETYCEDGFLGEYRFGCLSNPRISIVRSNLCNGAFDCPDLSDECLCSNFPQERCQRSTSGDKTTEQAETRYHQCLLEPKSATKCDGIPECVFFWDEECNCNEIPKFCTDINVKYGDFKGDNYENARIEILKICNGVSDYYNDADERGCEASRFYCTDEPLPNIPLRQICDGDEDCPNGVDELSSGPHFCCNDGGSIKYISSSMVCDSIQDCKLGSDECQNCIVSAFSDDSALISSKILIAFVWIISVVALVGCLVVSAVTTRDLIGPRNSGNKRNTPSHSQFFKILILSLSISDILVAVYTLIICIKALEFNEDYCLVDRRWRSSSTCSALGAILLIGSEQSVFTMVIIAAQRLHAISRPFSQPNIRHTIITLIISWVISIVLGIVPLISRFEDYFVSSIMFNENQIFKMMYYNETQYMIEWLSLMHQNSTIGDDFGSTDWSKIKNLTAEINPNISVNYEFGYYSSHTVCLPTFFPDRLADPAWGYSLLILLINFLAFLFMAVCYIILYRHASKIVKEQSIAHRQKKEKQNTKMQRKLTRIVVTDFLCWMPICIMGFIQILGVDIPKDAYLPAGLIIIPVNSALNPLLYSDLPDLVTKRLRRARMKLTQPSEISTEVIEMS